MLSPNKIALIHVGKKRLDLPDDDYRDILRRAAGVESARDLDESGFNQVMAVFQHLGFRSDFNKRHFGERILMASPRQVALIRDLWSEYGPIDPSDAGMGRWLGRTFKVTSIRFLSADQAPKVIAVLKAMIKRPRGNRSQHSA